MHTTVDRLMTVQDVADVFQTSPDTVQAMARSGELPGLRIGRAWRFRTSAVEAWARAREAAAGTDVEATS